MEVEAKSKAVDKGPPSKPSAASATVTPMPKRKRLAHAVETAAEARKSTADVSSPLASDAPRLASDLALEREGQRSGIPVSALKPNDLSLLGKMTPPPPGPRGLHAPDAPRDASELVSSTVAQTVGLRRMQDGNFPTYFIEVRNLLSIAWDVDRLVNRRKQKGASVGFTRTVFRMVQDKTGRIIDVRILQRSGDDELDYEALADFQRASESLPTPPPEAVRNRTQLASVWSFEHLPSGTVVSTTVQFDVVNLFDKHAIPKRSNKRLGLLMVE